jgi:hypothetical protein
VGRGPAHLATDRLTRDTPHARAAHDGAPRAGAPDLVHHVTIKPVMLVARTLGLSRHGGRGHDRDGWCRRGTRGRSRSPPRDRAEARGRRAMDLAGTRFGLSAVVDQTLAVYRKLLGA